ncbi:hypothetical protein [Endozoicomonas atrinae]|uniref:hypothetical protein n=1 Tax=Endozoicomonas atrinae TaxID=1333660 RepID=UPI003B008D08
MKIGNCQVRSELLQVSQPVPPSIFLNAFPTLPANHHNDNMLGAKSDGEAMTLFLNKSGARSEETLRRYEREITRLTHYCPVKHKPAPGSPDYGVN